MLHYYLLHNIYYTSIFIHLFDLYLLNNKSTLAAVEIVHNVHIISTDILWVSKITNVGNATNIPRQEAIVTII